MRPTCPVLPALLLALAALLGPATADAQDFSIEDVLSAPFPEVLVAARDAEVVAWISNHEGRRNVWVAQGPAWNGRPVTDWQEDDGHALSGLTLTPDGTQVLVTRGGAPNREGWVPTPAQDDVGMERTTFRIATAGGAPVETRAGTLSPDGRRMAWAEDDGIWVADFPDGEPREIARPRSGAGDLTWSPDNDRIAFVSDRGGHSFVGVAEVEDGGYRYLDASVDSDSEPVWSPDGDDVAFLRTAWEEPGLPFFARPTAATPWSIHVADADGDELQEVFRADPGAGSRFSGVNAEKQILWTEDGHLVFPWEKDGWKRLWTVDADGGLPRLLTPGDQVVQHMTLAPDGRTVVYDSNRNDLDRKHVWTLRPETDRVEQVTQGEGVEWAPVMTPSGQVAFLGSGPRMPARPFVLVDGERRVAPQGDVPGSFPDADELVTPQAVVFSATDGLPIHGQLFLPPELDEGERAPAVIFLHGGSRRQMLLGFHNRGYYHNAYALNQYLASAGYVVLAVNYRSGIGYGLDFREAENYGADGATEVRDVVGAGLWLAARDDVDPERIGLWGGSYGGFLTAQGLVHAPELFAAGVDIHGVHDWNEGIQNFVPDYEPSHDPELAERAFESSPLAYVDQWEDPVLLIHGDDDRNVRFTETARLVRELRRLGVPHDVLVFPDEVHGFLLHRNWQAAYEATADWFEEWLKRD